MSRRAPTNRKPGNQPIKLTDERIAKFLKAIEVGCPIRDACGCAGFSESSFYDWKRQAEAGTHSQQAQMLKLLDGIKQKEGEATERWLGVIEQAAQDGTWQAAAWKLERRRGMTQTVKQQLTGADEGPVKVEITDAKERLLAKLDQLANATETE